MKNLFKVLATLMFGLLLVAGAGVVPALASTTTLRVVQTPTDRLYTGLSGTATSMRITPYPKDLDNVKLTMTDLGSSPTVTVDPKVTGLEEILSFTGMVDNGDNTATLTGLTHDLASKYPYTTSGGHLITHGAGATVVFGNNPQLYGRLAALENDQMFTGTNTYASTTPPLYIGDPTWANFNGLIFADVNYVNSVVASGAPNASETVKGIIQLATGAQAILGTSLGSTLARLVLGNNLATSTPSATTPAGSVPVTGAIGGKLSQAFFDLTQQFGFSGGLLSTASTTITATTTIAASSVTNNALVLNTVKYAFPATQGVANSFLSNDGSGNLSWTKLNLLIGTSTATTSNVVGGVEVNISSSTIPANALGTTNVAIYQQPITNYITNGGAGTGSTVYKFYYGSNSITCTIAAVGTSANVGQFDFRVFANGTGNQILSVDMGYVQNLDGLTPASLTGFHCGKNTAITTDSTQPQPIRITETYTVTTGGNANGKTYGPAVVYIVK